MSPKARDNLRLAADIVTVALGVLALAYIAGLSKKKPI